MKHLTFFLMSSVFAGVLVAGSMAPAQAQDQNASTPKYATTQSSTNTSSTAQAQTQAQTQGQSEVSKDRVSAAAGSSERADAQDLVDQAVSVVKQMKSDRDLAKLLERAKGVFIMPDFGRAGLIVGGRGGAGVTLVHRNGKWSDPAFYDFGGVSIGAQAGASGGSVAFLLMTDNAVQGFKSGNLFSLNADADLSIITYSAGAQGSLGKGDVVFWSDTKGAYAGATLSVSDIVFDDQETAAFYGRHASASDIFSGGVNTARADSLVRALPD